MANGVNMRKAAALWAGIAQLLFGTLALAPELFGLGRAPVANQRNDWAFRSLVLAESLILAIFFFVIYRTAGSQNVSRAVRFTAVIAAGAMALENLVPAYATVLRAVAQAHNVLGWKFHPFKLVADVIATATPALATTSMIAFFLVVFTSSSPLQGTTARSSAALRLVSLAAVMVSIAALVWFFYAVVTTHLLVSFSILPVLRRLMTLVSLIAFFFVVAADQRVDSVKASAAITPSPGAK